MGAVRLLPLGQNQSKSQMIARKLLLPESLTVNWMVVNWPTLLNE
jgi:hypothetical protein